MERREEEPLNGVLLALRTQRVDHVVPGSPFFQELGDGLGGVLHVGIHQHHRIAPGVCQTGLNGRLVTEVSGQVDHADAIVPGGERVEDPSAAVTGAVVDEDDLVIGPAGDKRIGHALQEGRQHVGLVVDGHHHAEEKIVGLSSLKVA